MKKLVYVVGGDYMIEDMFRRQGWDTTRDMRSADLVQFTGGADVSPELYGEENLASYTQPNRDKIEADVFEKALNLSKPMAGICRGGQFLNVMSGGKMYQDVEGHATGRDHILFDLETDTAVNVTSTHHQEMIPAEDAEVVAIARLGGAKLKEGKSEEEIKNLPSDDIEVLFYERESSPILCFQPHPEYRNLECRKYYFDLLDRYIGL